MPQQWPDDILHVGFDCLDQGNFVSFGFWLSASGAQALDHDAFHLAVYDWYTFHMNDFLDCMHPQAGFITCRIERRGAVPARYAEVLAPNHGAIDSPTNLAVSSGLFLSPAITGRGLGSRLHIPGMPSRFIDSGARLSGYGIQQLQFAADSLASFPARLTTDWHTPTQLVTVSTRRAGHNLNPAQFSPTVVVRPTLRVDSTSRRLRSVGGFSPP